MTKPDQKTAMISSTAIDLPEHRKQVFDACLREDIFPIGMEMLPARDADAIQQSMEMVNKADIYIGIFAWRYGYVPKGHNISITEMEFNRAVERRIPILVFVIHQDHPIQIGMVEANSSAQRQLKKLKALACKGRGRVEFRSPAELQAQVIHALSDLKSRELQFRSPVEAIRDETKRLEELDPKASIEIAADAHSIHYQVQFPTAKLEFLNKQGNETLQAFFEKGQAFQIKGKDIPTDFSPILNELLSRRGDFDVTIKPAPTCTGCLQFVYTSSRGEPIHIQTGGEWVLAPKRAVFRGQLSDSPFFVEYVRDAGEDQKSQQYIVKCQFNFNVWKGQPLLGLAFFSELEDFVQQSEFSVRSFIRGNQLWPPESSTVGHDGRQQAIEAFEWLHKARQTAKYLQINPPFPKADTINANVAESKEVQLMIKLVELGSHEQNNAGQILGLSCDNPPPGQEVGKKGLTASLPGLFRKINFLGVEITFGPLTYTWTDLELVATRPLEGKRSEMTFKGGSKSVWRIEYKRPS